MRACCRHVAGGPSRDAGEGGSGGADVGRLVQDQLLSDIEQARDRCKPDVILRKLQQELPANVVSRLMPWSPWYWSNGVINSSSAC